MPHSASYGPEGRSSPQHLQPAQHLPQPSVVHLPLPVQASVAKFDQLRLLVERAVSRQQLAELDTNVRACLASINMQDINRIVGRDVRTIQCDAFIDIYESDGVSIGAYLLQRASHGGVEKGPTATSRGLRYGLPLHNHRNMFVWTAVLSGTMVVSSFDFVRSRDRKRDHRPLSAAELAPYLAGCGDESAIEDSAGAAKTQRNAVELLQQPTLRAPQLRVTSLPPEAVPVWAIDVARTIEAGDTRRMVTPKGGGEVHTIAAGGDETSGPLVFIDVSIPPYDRAPHFIPCTYFTEIATIGGASSGGSGVERHSSGDGGSGNEAGRRRRHRGRSGDGGGAATGSGSGSGGDDSSSFVPITACDDANGIAIPLTTSRVSQIPDATEQLLPPATTSAGQLMSAGSARGSTTRSQRRRIRRQNASRSSQQLASVQSLGSVGDVHDLPSGTVMPTGKKSVTVIESAVPTQSRPTAPPMVTGNVRKPKYVVAVEEPADLVLASCPLLAAVAEFLNRVH